MDENLGSPLRDPFYQKTNGMIYTEHDDESESDSFPGMKRQLTELSPNLPSSRGSNRSENLASRPILPFESSRKRRFTSENNVAAGSAKGTASQPSSRIFPDNSVAAIQKSSLINEITTLRKLNSDLKDQKSDLIIQLQRKDRELSMRSTDKDLEKMVAKYEGCKENLLQVTTMLESEHKELELYKSKLTEQSFRIEDLSAQNSRLLDERAALTEKHSEIISNFHAEFDSKLRKAVDQVEELKTTKIKLEMALDISKKENARICDDYNLKYQRLADEYEEVLRTKNEFDDAMNDHKAEVSEYKSKLTQREDHIMELETHCEKLIKTVNDTNSNNTQLSDQIEHYESKLSSLTKDLSECTDEKNKLQSVFDELEAHYIDLQQQFEAFHGESKGSDELIHVLTDYTEQLVKEKVRNTEKLNDEINRLRMLYEQEDSAHKQTKIALQEERMERELDSQFKHAVDTEEKDKAYINTISQLNGQLSDERELVRKLQSQIQDLKGSIRIVARVRPPNPSTNTQIPLELTSSQVLLTECEMAAIGVPRTKTLSVNFDRVFGPYSNNSDIAEETDYVVQSALDGRHAAIMAYGQTGSGKTWTMSGSDGVSIHALKKLMTATQSQDSYAYQISIEAVEIYNEQFRDLLGEVADRKGTELTIQRDPETGNSMLHGAFRYKVSTEAEAATLLSKAIQQRSTAATAANHRSSRSHFVFSAHIERRHKQGNALDRGFHGVLHLVDLAGSERMAHSQTTGDRAKETKAINTSLSALGNVINALLNKRSNSHIPFRNSKLTWLLQGAFCNDAKTMLLMALSPEITSVEETKSTLRFAEAASRAVIRSGNTAPIH